MAGATDNTLNIWCLMDGKAGHQNQVLGCAEAIQRKTAAQIHAVELSGWNRGVWSIFRTDKPSLPDVPPDLIIGAGHASHVPLCTLRRRFGGLSVVLMKPSLPLACFDICLVPDVHRLKRVPHNVILTKGVLNRVLPGTDKIATAGLLLVGGPSSHYRWSDEKVLQQVTQVLIRQPDMNWTIATSRRTPETFCRAVENGTMATLIRPDDVGSDWLPAQLSTAATVWVSEDSVSMTYEALTSGSQVGILELQRHRSNRVTDCIDTLVEANLVSRWSKWHQSGHLSRPAARFCEAERCATELLSRFRCERIVSRAA
jgi:uncharacterized protein